MQRPTSLADRIAERESATQLLRRWTYGLVAAGAGLVAVLSFVAAGTFAGHQQAAAADQQAPGTDSNVSQVGQLQQPAGGFFGGGRRSGGGGSGGGVVTGGS